MINAPKHYHFHFRPLSQRTDNRGTEIRVGSQVAYNLSGQIAVGVVEKINTKSFGIRLAHNAAGCPPGHLSNVKNSKGMLVIFEIEDDTP